MNKKEALLASIEHWKENIILQYNYNPDEYWSPRPDISAFSCALCDHNRVCNNCILDIYGFRCTSGDGAYEDVLQAISKEKSREEIAETMWNMYTVLLLVALSEGYLD